jgi:hypothetical protein
MGISRENMQNSSSLGQYDDEKSDTEGSGGAKVPDPFVPTNFYEIFFISSVYTVGTVHAF